MNLRSPIAWEYAVAALPNFPADSKEFAWLISGIKPGGYRESSALIPGTKGSRMESSQTPLMAVVSKRTQDIVAVVGESTNERPEGDRNLG